MHDPHLCVYCTCLVLWKCVERFMLWSSEEIGFEHDLDKLLLTDLPISISVCLLQHALQEIILLLF